MTDGIPAGTEEPADAGAAAQDWLRVLITRFVRTAGLLQPDQPLLRGHHISLSEGFALAELAASDAPPTQADLAERLNLEKSTVSRLVAGLERQRLVVRRRNPANRRYYQLALTEHGRSAVSHLVISMHEHHTRILAAMTPVERDALATGLTALLRAMGQTPPPHTPAGHPGHSRAPAS